AIGTEDGDLHVRDDGILNVGRCGIQNDRALTHGLHLAERFGEGAERSLLGPVADTPPRVAVDVPDGVTRETCPRHVVTSRGIATGLARRTLLVRDAGSTGFADTERGVATAGPEVVAGANHADVQAAADGVTVVAGLGVV